MDFLARVATFCSDEEFYLGLFPMLYWGPICNAKLGYNLCVCVGLGVPIGNLLKNIYCVRRPSSPLLWQFHTSNEEQEFALPSTHALLSASVSLLMASHYISHYDHHQSFVPVLSWFLFVVSWTVCISLSRVYMGAHTFQDIVLGGTIGVIYGIVLSVILEIFHEPLVFGSLWIVLSSSGILLLWLHAHPIDKSSQLNFHLSEGTFDYTSPLLGLALGGVLSRTWYSPVQEQCISSWNSSLLVRYLIGAPMSIAIYISSKKILPHVIEPIMKALKIKAHYIPYSEFTTYLTQEIKSHSPKLQENGVVAVEGQEGLNGSHTNGHVGSNNGKTQLNPEYLLSWVRVYTKCFVYIILTYTITVFVPITTGLLLNK